uniref:Dihydrodipicolinate synthase-like, mitochondrial n=1 Tax=Magallana gigas TaxID=29159 RepID=K1Q307_MAGGI
MSSQHNRSEGQWGRCCVGGVCGAANMLGQELCDLEQLYKQGKLKEATNLQQRIVAPNACVTKRFGVPGLKVAMEWFGYYGGPVRSPLQPITMFKIKNPKEKYKTGAEQTQTSTKIEVGSGAKEE